VCISPGSKSTSRERSSHGKPRHYLRKPGHKAIALPGLPYSTEFMDAYQAALTNAMPVEIGAKRSAPGTVAEAVARYLASAAFVELATTTQKLRRPILERFRSEHGHRPMRAMREEHDAKIISRLRPYAQRNMLKTLRSLMAFSLAEGLVDVDPTATVKLKPAKDTGGFQTWPIHCIEQYRAHHKLGTTARLALELLLATMQRRADIVRLGRQHMRNGILSLQLGKTGMQVDIPARAGGGDRRNAAGSFDLPNDGVRQASLAAGLLLLVRRTLQGGRYTEGVCRPWTTQGWRGAACRAWMHRPRNHGVGRLDNIEGGGAVHEGSESKMARTKGSRQAQNRNRIG
jgi:integrase